MARGEQNVCLEAIAARFEQVRDRSVQLVATLCAEDQQIQAFDYASPTKWHLAHTTWFFETFVLGRWQPTWEPLHPEFAVLFNSYYEGVGERFARAQRGVLSRPTLAQVHDYRRQVDESIHRLLTSFGDRIPHDLRAGIELGLAHEEQHQELILTDILANLSVNPMRPAWGERPATSSCAEVIPRWIDVPGGLVEIGHAGPEFHFDNESPRHRSYVADFGLRSTLVTNAEVMAFIADGGYDDHRLWLSDGLAWVREHGIQAPAYWQIDSDGQRSSFTLYGQRPLDPNAPVTHLSAYEADAIATWLGARLPSEREWELAALRSGTHPNSGRWLGDGPVQPLAASRDDGGLLGLWGETWEWTRSAYEPYPGFEAAVGAVGEYNGKFMANQWVLRGGSCATPPGHVRGTYRNFFHPDQRWQFTGLRLAQTNA